MYVKIIGKFSQFGACSINLKGVPRRVEKSDMGISRLRSETRGFRIIYNVATEIKTIIPGNWAPPKIYDCNTTGKHLNIIGGNATPRIYDGATT